MFNAFKILTFIGAAFGAIALLIAIADSSAPRAAAGAGIAIALVVIPYCVTKAIWMSQQMAHSKEMLEALKAKQHTTPAA